VPLVALGRVALREVVLVEGRVEEGPFPEPVRLMELATELREAPELDLLRFSFELVGRLVLYLWLRAELVLLLFAFLALFSVVLEPRVARPLLVSS